MMTININVTVTIAQYIAVMQFTRWSGRTALTREWLFLFRIRVMKNQFTIFRF